jgi:hypothetical protein
MRRHGTFAQPAEERKSMRSDSTKDRKDRNECRDSHLQASDDALGARDPYAESIVCEIYSHLEQCSTFPERK